MWLVRGPWPGGSIIPRKFGFFYCENLCVRRTEGRRASLCCPFLPLPHLTAHTHTGVSVEVHAKRKGSDRDRASPPPSPSSSTLSVARWTLVGVVGGGSTWHRHNCDRLGSTLAGRQVLGVGWTTDKGLDERAGLGWWGNQDTRTPGHECRKQGGDRTIPTMIVRRSLTARNSGGIRNFEILVYGRRKSLGGMLSRPFEMLLLGRRRPYACSHTTNIDS